MAKMNYPLVLPYFRGISEQLRMEFRSFNILAYVHPTKTLWQLLVHPNDKVQERKVVGPVYHITCDDWDAMYVGDMDRSLKTWF